MFVALARAIVEEMRAEERETADVVRVEVVPRVQRRDRMRSACCLRKRSHGVSSETSVASYIWTAMPKNSAKLYCISEYSFALQLLVSALALVLRDQRLRTVRIHANDLAATATTARGTRP